ncbi:cytochrome P450 [Kitasatospora brasiliensis]|uniref:cytochrome P450 n=1 Tax=Kitasatospora brasiliensis TaxID=3058040 RepID=UPI00292FDFF8|nr:cytochrome P450 [Kitasatospora sp. K002]
MIITRPEGGSGAFDFAAVDLVDPTTYTHGDPHAVWDAMRRHDPVCWHPVGDDLGFWSITKYEDASWVLRDHTVFTSQRGTLLNLLGKDDPAGGRQMAATDPPRHTRMREPLQRALTIKSVEKSAERIRQEVRRLLSPALTGKPFDFAETVTQLPMAVTGMLMGLPPEDWPLLTRLTVMSIAPDDPEFTVNGDAEATLQLAHRELFAYFSDIVRHRQSELDDGLISLLLTMEVDGRKLSLGEILSNCYSLLLGANVTTPYVPTAAFAELMGTSLLEEWLTTPELVGSGTEEALRWASPANHFMRYAVKDVTLRGKTIRSGDAVVVWLGSANRDEEAFPDPFRFDLRRRPNRHIAFGSGAHYCVGHTVARVSLRILFEELLTGFSSVESAGPVEHLSSNFVAGIKHMPVTAALKPEAEPLFAAARTEPVR